jgi:predicted nuclease of predicted toxin-antitoxin system
MCWWKTALYDTCSLITLDKLILERAALAGHFPSTILALEESLSADQLREETAQRMRSRVTVCGLPAKLGAILVSANLPRALARVDTLVYATAVHGRLSVVTADKRLAKAIRAAGLQFANIALILRNLVASKHLSKRQCEELLKGLAARNDFLLGTPTATWADLEAYSFPD